MKTAAMIMVLALCFESVGIGKALFLGVKYVSISMLP